MFAICIESSNKRGMGHFYRALNFIKLLDSNKEPYIILLNKNPKSISILKKKNLPFETVPLDNFKYDWETDIIKKYKISIWLNDRLDTKSIHTKNIKKNGIKIVTLDDRGTGAAFADFHFSGFTFDKAEYLEGKNIFTGIDYLILNDEIERKKRIRKVCKKILVTLGGSDTYGVTIKIIEILKQLKKHATIITGPEFAHDIELKKIVNENFKIKKHVPSLIEEFYQYDLAITGGGITPFEANASGLPCIIIANELFEIPNAKFLQKIGSSIFAGFYKEIDKTIIDQDLPIKTMSEIGMNTIHTNGAENIYRTIRNG
jgi:spore coat polysaccharide biosynthesis predicted glycosyltransferase SpsG